MLRQVEIGSVINRAKRRLGLQNTFEEDGYLQLLAEEGLRDTNATDAYAVSCETVEIDCNSARLPERYDELIGFQFGDGTTCSGCCHSTTIPVSPGGNQLVASCACWSFYTYSQYNVISHRPCGWYGNYFSIQNGFINFPSTITATEITVYFKGFNEDENGFMVFNLEQQRGLSAYMAYQYSLDKLNTGAYTESQNNKWLGEWKEQKNRLNGKEAIRKFKLRKQELSLIVNAIMMSKNYYLPYGC